MRPYGKKKSAANSTNRVMLSTPRADEVATVSRVIIADTANRVIEKMPIVLG